MYRLFKAFDPNVSMVSRNLNWLDLKESATVSLNMPQAAISPRVFHLQCGNSVCDFQLLTFEFIWDESKELLEESSESSDTSGDEGSVSSSTGDLQDTTKPILQDITQDSSMQQGGTTTTEKGGVVTTGP
jgi:hypothetical protein